MGVFISESFGLSKLVVFLIMKIGYIWISEFIVWFLFVIFIIMMFFKKK